MIPGYRPGRLRGKVNRGQITPRREDSPPARATRAQFRLRRAASRLDSAASNFAGSAATAENLIENFKILKN